MTDTRLSHQAAEALAREQARRLSHQAAEVLAREPLLRLNHQALETVAVPLPDTVLAHQAAEVIARPVPGLNLYHQYAEVLWHERATPDLMPWRHNWAAEVRERLEWKTDVMRSRSEDGVVSFFHSFY